MRIRRNPIMAVVAAFAVASLGSVTALAQDAPAMDEVLVQLDFVPRGEHSIFFIAEDQGYFAEVGIHVIAVRNGTGSANTMRVVGANGAEFGFGDLPTLSKARSQEIPVVALVAVQQRSPMAMLTISERHSLTQPKDLEGLKVGVNPAGSTYVFYQAFAALNGLDRSTITEVTVKPPAEQYLLQGQIDALPGYVNAEIPELENLAGGPGSLDILLGADFGYNVFGSGLLTSDRLISTNPDLVSRFTKAYVKAFEFMLQNPEQAADILIAARPELAEKKDVLVKQIVAQTPLATSAVTEEHGLGYMDAAQWEATVNILLDQEVITTAPEIAKLFDNSFLPAAD